jgi:TolB-like protein/Tfp pilus assembly protein PilF
MCWLFRTCPAHLAAAAMKRCPQCHRVEADDALAFCRVDGTPLVRDGSAAEGAGTLKFSPSQGADTTETRILPTDEGLSRPTAATTTLGGQQHSGGTRELSKPKSRRGVVLVVAALAVVAVAAAAIYFSRKGDTAIHSVAVLPFENRSDDADAEYLSDGLAESLIYRLSQLPNLRVSPTSSVFRYKGKETDAVKVGNELGVQAVLSGRVVQRGESLTVSVELVDVRNNKLLWGEQYKRKMSELLATQREIAAEITDRLRLELSGADEQRLAKNYTENTEAYQLYLQGRFFWSKRTPRDMGKAIGYFQQAIAVDPNYALAYAGLADALAQPSDVVPPRERPQRSREAALKALSLDNDMAEAHTALAHILTRYDLDFAGAERELRRAHELDPKWADTYQRYGELLTYLGRHEEALDKFRQGLEVEPFCLPCRSAYGSALNAARRYDEAIAQLRKALEFDPNFGPAYSGLSNAYRIKGMYAESVEARARFLELGGDSQGAARVREGFARGGWEGYLRAEHARYATAERSIDRFSYYSEAVLLAALGEKDEAFVALNKSHEAREYPALVLLKVDPRLDPLRDDPRFADLVRRVGLPQ